MGNRMRSLTVGCLVLLCMQLGCSVPRMLWPQRDTAASELEGQPTAPHVLLASRSSEFKDELVVRLKNALKSEGVTLRVMGIEQLKGADTGTYSAVVVICTCIAWGLDPDVQDFIDRHSDRDNLIVVVTSGDGGWLPDKARYPVDAVSSASRLVSVEAVALDVLARIHSRLHNDGPAE